jgi:hypothetical protein
VAGGQLQDSDNIGERSAQVPFREIGRDAGILVGLEVGLSRWGDREIPYAIRPIYRRGGREQTGGSAGSLSADEVRRRVRVVAKPDYAVGGIWLRTGAAMDRLSLVFMRIRGASLDTADNYASEWVGTSDGGGEPQYLDGGGRPVVGLFAETEGKQARNFGLIFARVPVPAPKTKDSRPAAAAAIDPPAPNPAESGQVKKSNLELEAEAHKEQESGGVSAVVIILIVLGVIGVPLAVVGYFVLGQKEPPPAPIADDPAERPRRMVSQLPSLPVSERPELARRLQPYLPATIPTTTLTTAIRAERSTGGEPPPPFFLVRATYRARRDRMTRIYVLPGELLVIDAGPGADQNVVAGLATAALTGGGLVGAFLGGQVAAMVADGQKAGGEVLQRRLDQMDLPALLVRATEEGNFRARYEELTGVTIDPPDGKRWGGEPGRAVGTFRFRHLRRGEYSFEFLNGAEIRGAIELLRRTAQANNVHVGSGWDEATAIYLADL